MRDKRVKIKNQIDVFREKATSTALSGFSRGTFILVELEFGVLVVVEGGKKVNP